MPRQLSHYCKWSAINRRRCHRWTFDATASHLQKQLKERDDDERITDWRCDDTSRADVYLLGAQRHGRTHQHARSSVCIMRVCVCVLWCFWLSICMQIWAYDRCKSVLAYLMCFTINSLRVCVCVFVRLHVYVCARLSECVCVTSQLMVSSSALSADSQGTEDTRPFY